MLTWASDEQAGREELESGLCLFQLPGHLRSVWWELLQQSANDLGSGQLPGFDAFVTQIVDFLAFKELPVPPGAKCDLIVTQRESSDGIDKSAREQSPQLVSSIESMTPSSQIGEQKRSAVWGGINVGDEIASFAVINFDFHQMAVELLSMFPETPRTILVGELANRFLHSCPDYPPVRVTLAPGEGFRLPRLGAILEPCPRNDDGNAGLFLMFRETGSAASTAALK